MDKLSPKQELFCTYYLEDFNSTRAYLRAYNCTYDTARAEGYRNLEKPCVKREINKLKKAKLDKINVTSELIIRKVLEEYLKIAFSDVKDIYDNVNGELVLKDLDKIDSSVIRDVIISKDGVNVKMHDKLKALAWLDEHYGTGKTRQGLEVKFIEANIKVKEREAGVNKDDEDNISNWLEATTPKADAIEELFANEEADVIFYGEDELED